MGCDVVDINNETPVMMAARNGLKSSLTVLLEHKPDLTARRNDGYTALMLAVLENQIDTIPALLQADPNPNALGPDGHSAMTMAAAGAVKDPQGSALRALLSAKIPKGRLDLNQPMAQDGKTALMIVSNNNQPELVKLLLDADASAAGFDADGSSPLMHAINGACDDCVRHILATESGASSVNERDTKGWSALMLASRSFYGDDMIAGLLAHGADPTMQAKEEWTALHIAASRGSFQPCTLLLEG